MTTNTNTTDTEKIEHENNFAIFLEHFSSLSLDDRLDKYKEILFDENHEFHNRTTELLNRFDDDEFYVEEAKSCYEFYVEEEKRKKRGTFILRGDEVTGPYRIIDRLENHIIETVRKSLCALEEFADKKKYDSEKFIGEVEELTGILQYILEPFDEMEVSQLRGLRELYSVRERYEALGLKDPLKRGR